MSQSKKSQKSGRPRNAEACEPEEYAPTRGSHRQEVKPGLYRVRVERCEAERPKCCGWQVKFGFDLRAPAGVVGGLEVSFNTERREEGDLLCRVFAVLGAVVEDEDDLPLACREVVGRHAFVEVLSNGAGVHVQQLATTHTVASPPDWWVPFPDGDDLPLEDIYAEEDLTDPEFPRFYGCDAAAKAELRLHPNERLRVLRAGHGLS